MERHGIFENAGPALADGEGDGDGDAVATGFGWSNEAGGDAAGLATATSAIETTEKNNLD